jgi:hypothetical protein
MTTLRTDQLQPGVRIQLPGPNVVRTVDRVVPSEWLNARNETIFYVYYREGSTPEWSEGNSGIASTLWTVACTD